MKSIKHNLPLLFLGALLWLVSLALTSCLEEPAKINIKMVSDYSQIVEAINRTDRSLTEKVSLVEAALASGFADSKAARQMLQQAVSSLTGTLAEKLSAVEAAVRSQTASLEIKLSLIEAAVTAGFADRTAQQALTREAVEALSGTAAERLTQIETTLKGQTASLEMKLALIETAVSEGLADGKSGIELLQQAVSSLTGTTAERLQAIEAAVEGNSASLSAKLDLIAVAIDNRLAGTNDALELFKQAVEALEGTLEEKLAAVEEAVNSQTASLDTKLGLIEAAARSGFADYTAQKGLLLQALKALGGTQESKLDSIAKAINSQTVSLDTKLGLIETAENAGFKADTTQQVLIMQAIESLEGTLAEKLSAIDTAVCNQTLALWVKLGLIEAGLKEGLSDEAKALGQIEAALSTSLIDGFDSVVTALSQVNATLEGQVTFVLRDIATAISRGYDYRSIVLAIQRAVDKLSGEKHMINGHEYVEMGHGLKWATCNVGASRPEESGDYFAWAEITPYYIPGHAHDNTTTDGSNWKEGKSYGYADSSNVYFDKANKRYTKYITEGGSRLESEDDAARQNWGGTWRMPTESEWGVLFNDNSEYDLEWTSNYNGTGVAGMIVTSKMIETLGNQIFLPAAGYWDKKKWYEKKDGQAIVSCWTSSSVSSSLSKKLDIVNGVKAFKEGDRNLGCSVRPVSD